MHARFIKYNQQKWNGTKGVGWGEGGGGGKRAGGREENYLVWPMLCECMGIT